MPEMQMPATEDRHCEETEAGASKNSHSTKSLTEFQGFRIARIFALPPETAETIAGLAFDAGAGR